MINVITFYRMARWLYLHRVPLLPKLIKLHIFLMYNCSIPYTVSIGKGSFFNHAGIGVLINERSEIGENCKIGNNVSIIGQGPYRYGPSLGNRVFVGSGAVVQGQVVIEDNVIIAPNAVVNKSVPANKIVAGIPARIVGDVRELDYDIFKDEDFKDETRPYLS